MLDDFELAQHRAKGQGIFAAAAVTAVQQPVEKFGASKHARVRLQVEALRAVSEGMCNDRSALLLIRAGSVWCIRWNMRAPCIAATRAARSRSAVCAGHRRHAWHRHALSSARNR